MRLRALPLLAALTTAAALGAPAVASADLPPVPCVNVGNVVTVGCDATADPTVSVPAVPAAPSAAAQLCPGADDAPTAANLVAMTKSTLCLVNHERTSRGLRALRLNSTLTSVGVAYAKKMVAQDFFDHTSPNGVTFESRIRHTKYLTGSIRRWSIGENIAWGTSALATPGAIVDAWMHSPGHRRNILDPSFVETGMGVALGAPDAGADDANAATYSQEFGQRVR